MPHHMTLGVEEELHVVDLATGALVPRGDEVLALARPRLGDRVTRELNLCQIETATPICRDLGEVADAVQRSRRELLDAAGGLGLGVIAAGTHPYGRWEEQEIDRSRPRYRALERTYEALAREQIICGCHVHVGFEDVRDRFPALTEVRVWLPVLLALSANSPRWQCEDTGYASFRHQVWRRWPTSGLPPELRDEADYEHVVQALVDAEAVADGTFLYWDVRPSERYPTLEIRAFDTLLRADDVAALAGAVRALLWTAVDDRSPALRPMRPEVLDAAMWRASRYGLAADLVSPLTGEIVPAGDVVEALLERCAPGLAAHGDTDVVATQLRRIVERGSGSAEQRRAVTHHGDDPAAVVRELVALTGGVAAGSASAA